MSVIIHHIVKCSLIKCKVEGRAQRIFSSCLHCFHGGHIHLLDDTRLIINFIIIKGDVFKGAEDNNAFFAQFFYGKQTYILDDTHRPYLLPCFEIVKEAWKYSTCLLLLSPSMYLVFGVSSMFKKIPQNTKPVVSQYSSFG